MKTKSCTSRWTMRESFNGESTTMYILLQQTKLDIDTSDVLQRDETHSYIKKSKRKNTKLKLLRARVHAKS